MTRKTPAKVAPVIPVTALLRDRPAGEKVDGADVDPLKCRRGTGEQCRWIG